MENKQLKEITGRFDMLIRLIASDKIKGKSAIDQVAYLMRAGFPATQISNIVEKPINTVTSYMSRLRKRG